MVIVENWLYLRIYELIDKHIRYKNHLGDELYQRFYADAMRIMRRSAELNRSEEFADYHETTILKLPQLKLAEREIIMDLLTQEIHAINAKILISNNAEENDLMQFEILALRNFCEKFDA